MSTYGSAVWSGGLKDGKGSISTKSGALKDYPYGFAARFEDAGLIRVGHRNLTGGVVAIHTGWRA